MNRPIFFVAFCALLFGASRDGFAKSTRQSDGSLAPCPCEHIGQCRCERAWNIRFLSPRTGKVWGSYSAKSADELQRMVEQFRKLEADCRAQFGDKPQFHDYDQAEGPYCEGCANPEKFVRRDALDLQWRDYRDQLTKIWEAARGEGRNPFADVGGVLTSYGIALTDAYKKLTRMRHELIDALDFHNITDAQLAAMSRELDASLQPSLATLRGGGSTSAPAPAGNPDPAGLIAAAKGGQADQVTAMLKAGTGADAQDGYGYSALMWAIRSGNADAAKALLENGASINLQAKDGYTALMFAAQRNDETLVRFLLAHGANKKLRQSNGFTALDIAGGEYAKKNMAALLK